MLSSREAGRYETQQASVDTAYDDRAGKETEANQPLHLYDMEQEFRECVLFLNRTRVVFLRSLTFLAAFRYHGTTV